MNPSVFSLNDFLPQLSGTDRQHQAGIVRAAGTVLRRTAVITAAALFCIFSPGAGCLYAADSELTDGEPSVTFQLGSDPAAFLRAPVSLSIHSKIPVCGRIDAFMHLTADGISASTEHAPATLLDLFEAGFTHSISLGVYRGTDKELLTEIGVTASSGILMPYQKLSCRYTRESAPFSIISQASCRWIYPLTAAFREQITVLEVINRHIGVSVTAAAGLTNETAQTETFPDAFPDAQPAIPDAPSVSTAAGSEFSEAESSAGRTQERLSPTEQFTSFSSSFDISSQISIIEEKTRHHIGFSLSFVQTGVLPGIQYSCSIIL